MSRHCQPQRNDRPGNNDNSCARAGSGGEGVTSLFVQYVEADYADKANERLSVSGAAVMTGMTTASASSGSSTINGQN